MLNPIDNPVLSLVIFLFILLFAPNRLYQRPKANEPPLEAGFLPWLGVGLQMRDMETFLARNFAKYGDTFTAYAAGKRLVITKDMVIIKHSFQSPDLSGQPNAEAFYKRFLKSRLPTPQEDAAMHRVTHSTLSGSALAEMRERFHDLLVEALENFGGGEVDFFPWAQKIIFNCASRVLLGPEFPAADAMPLFFGWDNNFKGMMTGTGPSAPDSTSIKKSHACRDQLLYLFSHYLRDHLTSTSPYIQLQWEKLDAMGVSWDDKVAFAALRSFWVGAANVTPAAIWATAFSYNDASLAARLRGELANGDSSLLVDERSASSKLVAEETMRLAVLGSIARTALTDTLVPTGGQGHLLVRKGDMVLGQGRDVHRMFERPDEFIFDRLEQARKTGEKDIGYIPFGGGKGICPGRHFAYSETQIVTLVMLSTFNLEPLSPFPEISTKGVLGLAIARPSRPWRVRLTRRTPNV